MKEISQETIDRIIANSCMIQLDIKLIGEGRLTSQHNNEDRVANILKRAQTINDIVCEL